MCHLAEQTIQILHFVHHSTEETLVEIDRRHTTANHRSGRLIPSSIHLALQENQESDLGGRVRQVAIAFA